MNNRNLGSCYEEKAAAYLTKQGYEILEKNFRCKMGEIDLIARQGEYLVFVEVKYRKNTNKGYPAEAVGFSKQRRIQNTARYYLYKNHYPDTQPCRFDVVSILGEEITLMENAF